MPVTTAHIGNRIKTPDVKESSRTTQRTWCFKRAKEDSKYQTSMHNEDSQNSFSFPWPIMTESKSSEKKVHNVDLKLYGLRK